MTICFINIGLCVQLDSMALSKNQTIAIVAIVVIIIIAAVAAIALSDDDDNDSKDNNNVTPSDDNNKTKDDDYYKNGITIKNAVASTTSQNTFTLNKMPERVVCLFQGNVELMCMFGLQDKIVGAFVRGENMKTLNAEYQDAYDSVKKTVVQNSKFSREEVMDCNPDLIIGWSSSFSDSQIGTIESWNKLGVNCYRTNLYGNSNGTSVDTYYQMLRDIGAMFNKNDEANAAISDWNAIIKKNADTLANANITEKKKVLIIDYKSNPDASSTLVYGTSMLTGNLINMAGGNCISSGRMDSYSYEEIANMDFDAVMIVSLGYYTTLTQAEHDKIVNWFYDIPAFSHFKDKQVDALPFYTLYMSGILDNDCLTDIFDSLYPELVKSS